MRRLTIPVLGLLLVACGGEEEAACVRAYSDAVEPLFQRERALAKEYAAFLRAAETSDLLHRESRADLLARYSALAEEIAGVATPCESVTAAHAVIQEAVAARRTSLERMVAVEGEIEAAVAVEEKLKPWIERSEVAEREQRRNEIVEQMGQGRQVVLAEAKRFVELVEGLAAAAGGTAPPELQSLCVQSQSLMSPLERAHNAEAMLLVLRGGLERVERDHRALLARAKAARAPDGAASEAWDRIVAFLEERQEVLARFVELQLLEQEIRRLDEVLQDFDRVGRELQAVQNRVTGLMNEALAKDRFAAGRLEEFERQIKRLRARVL